MKWCTIGFGIDVERYKILEKWLKDSGIDNEFVPEETSPTDFSEKLPKLLEVYDQIRIDSPFRHEAFVEIKKHEAQMVLLRAADTFYKDPHGNWWLRLAGYHAMNDLINSMEKSLELEGDALIVGAGGGARAAIATLVKAGFQKFNITNAFDDQATELISEMKKMYFSVEFRFVSQSQLVLLPGTNSIVVNTTPFTKTNEILDELHFFNFLTPKGIVWDLTIRPIETPLIKEALEVGARVFRGYEFAALTDSRWAGWVAPDNNLSIDNYRDELKKYAEKGEPEDS